MTPATRHPLHKRVWWWLRTGRASPPGRGYFTWLKEPSPWTKPWRAWKVILGRRRVFAPPLFYIMLFALGSVIGVILHLTLGFSWWITPVALVVLAWLWFLSTIWVGNGSRYTVSLREELLGVFKPEMAEAKAKARMRAEIGATSLGFYTPAHLHHLTPHLGWSGSESGIESVTLTCVEHDPAKDSMSVLCIVQTLQGHLDLAVLLDEVRSHLMSEALKQARDTLPPPESEDEYQARHDAIVHETLREAETLTWSPGEMIINADRIAAHTSTSHGLRFTYGKLNNEWLLITEILEDEPGVVEDSAPYAVAVAGSEAGAGAGVLELVEIRDRDPLIERMFEPWQG